MNKKTAIFALILGVVVAVPLLKNVGRDKSKQVDVVSPENRVIQSSILASGRLAHEDQVRITAEVIGRVTRVLIEEGDSVNKGDLLLTIDDKTIKATVEQREASVRMQQISIERQEAQINNLEKQWARNKMLHQQKLLDDDAFEAISNNREISKIDLKSAQESLYQAQAQLAQAQDQLSKTRVYAPINGVITSLDIKEGETAIASSTNIAGSSLMTIANPNSVITEVFVDEADVANIALNQTASIVAIAYPDTPISGIVKSIASTAKSASGRQGLSFLVKLEVLNEQNIRLRPGMSCRAEIFTSESSPVLSIPIQAIITEEKRTQNTIHNYVFLADGNAAEKRLIEVGNSDDTFQQVVKGLTAQDSIVVGPNRILRHLKDGDNISVTGATQ